MSQKMSMAFILAFAAVLSSPGKTLAAEPAGSSGQQQSQPEVKSPTAPWTVKPIAAQQGISGPAVKHITKDIKCDGCYIIFHDREQPGTFTYLCGEQRMASLPTCSPCVCKKRCSDDSPFFQEPKPPEPEPDDGYWLPDTLITGPQAEVEIQYRTREGLRQSIRVPRSRELTPGQLPISEVESLEVRCKNPGDGTKKGRN
ncbi:MAG TPA: hypothetical protein VE057_17020 [Archangium sp.]|nr:hypothetical protein [Archangium sp.]